jgi:hypothetical protein
VGSPRSTVLDEPHDGSWIKRQSIWQPLDGQPKLGGLRNLKKRIENRVRGWLPKEPTLPKAPAKIEFQINQQDLPLKQRTSRTGWVLIFLALFFMFIPFVYSILTFPDGYSIWVTASGILGASLVLAFVRYQYRRISRMKNKQDAT